MAWRRPKADEEQDEIPCQYYLSSTWRDERPVWLTFGYLLPG